MRLLSRQLGLISFGILVLAVHTAQASVLPDVLTDVKVALNTARWTIPDIVEVRRIKGTAVQGASRLAAFILEQPSIADGKNHYGLYEIDAARGGPPRKIAEADYMADLAWRPGTQDWTVRADFGAGVQLYTVKRSGLHQPLLVIPDTRLVGGAPGVLHDSIVGPHMTGVVSYGWSQDGRRFWFTRMRQRDKTKQSTLSDAGIVYNPNKQWLVRPDSDGAINIDAYELRVFDTVDGSDRLVATTWRTNVVAFGPPCVAWADASHLRYCQEDVDDSGAFVWSQWRFDLGTGEARNVRFTSLDDFSSVATQGGYITVRHQGSTSALVEVDIDGRVIKRYGEVSAKRLAGNIWRSSANDKFIFETRLSDREGLDAFPQGPLSRALALIPDNLSACSFNADLSFGVCSDESLVKAPALVSVSGATGAVTVLARPNARYGAIKPLKILAHEWTNRYGDKNTGYVTYPRNYVTGRSYPALLVTHGGDARNDFARGEFQWEFPIQVFAEHGYFILSVNEPKHDPGVPEPYFVGGVEAGIEKQEFNQFVNPMASMEAAVEPLIASGEVNPKAIGIAGYSQGANITYFVISHSKLFSAASMGDDSGVIPSMYFDGGETWLKALYGGSPYDAAALDNYRKYSTSFRINDVKSPLLQQYASIDMAELGQPLYSLLKGAGIPTELVDYPTESHIFYAPRSRASAMARNLDWFNYWLLGHRDPDPAKAAQYARWDAMAAHWREAQQVPEVSSGLGISGGARSGKK